MNEITWKTDSDGHLLTATGPSRPTVNQYDLARSEMSRHARSIADAMVSGFMPSQDQIERYTKAREAYEALASVYFHRVNDPEFFRGWAAGDLIPEDAPAEPPVDPASLTETDCCQ